MAPQKSLVTSIALCQLILDEEVNLEAQFSLGFAPEYKSWLCWVFPILLLVAAEAGEDNLQSNSFTVGIAQTSGGSFCF